MLGSNSISCNWRQVHANADRKPPWLSAVILLYCQLNDQTFQTKSGQEKGGISTIHNNKNAEKKKKHPGLHNPMIFKLPCFSFRRWPPASGVSAVRLKNDIGWLALIFMTWMLGMLERFHPYEAPQNTSANETSVTKRWDRILYFTKKWLHPILKACEIFELS